MAETIPSAVDRPDVGWRLDFVSWTVLALVAGLVVYQVMIPPIVGYADNGDFHRVLDPYGLTHDTDPETWDYFYFVDPTYQWTEPRPVEVISSELLLAGVAVGLHKVFGGEGEFDIRVLGGVHTVFYLLGVYLILTGLQTFSRRVRWLAAVCLLLAAADTPYVVFLNSFYAEAAALVFLAISLGLLLRMARSRSGSRMRTVLYYLAVILFTGAKLQYIWLALPLLAAPLLLHTVRPRFGGRSLEIGLAVVVLVVVGSLTWRIPGIYREMVEWDAVFNAILVASPDPAADLEELGLPPEMAEHQGTTFCSPGVPFHATMDQYGLADVARFYLRHPGRIFAVAAACADSCFVWKETRLANQQVGADGPATAQALSLTGWCGFQGVLFPAALWFLLAVFGLSVGGLAYAWHASTGDPDVRNLVVAGGAVVAMAVLAYLVAVVAQGLTETVKHLFLFQVLFDVGLVTVLCLGTEALGRQFPGRWWEATGAVGREDRRQNLRK